MDDLSGPHTLLHDLAAVDDHGVPTVNAAASEHSHSTVAAIFSGFPRAAVEAFRESGRSEEQGVEMLSASVAEYDVAEARSLT